MAEKRLTRKSFPKKQRMHKESVSKQGRKFQRQDEVKIDFLSESFKNKKRDNLQQKKGKFLHDINCCLKEDFLLNKDHNLSGQTPTKNQYKKSNDDYLEACRETQAMPN
ncbi:hypothetical protein Tco_0830641 [Tanacetum coccineum]